MLLIRLGAKIDEATLDDGATPLYIAATQGHVRVLEVLADHGASVNTQCTDDGTTPLFKACQNQHVNVVKALLLRNADTTLATALEQGQGGGGFGFAPLHAAVQSGSYAIVGMLLEHGVPAGMVTTDMYVCKSKVCCARHTLLHMACIKRDMRCTRCCVSQQTLSVFFPLMFWSLVSSATLPRCISVHVYFYAGNQPGTNGQVCCWPLTVVTTPF